MIGIEKMDGIIWYMEQVVVEEDMADVEEQEETDNRQVLEEEAEEDMELMEVME